MNSARRPEPGGSTLLGVPSGPASGSAPDTTPAGLFNSAAAAIHPAHLVPCAACGALNGRSALACWSCEADLLALAQFAKRVEPVLERQPEPEPKPEPVAAGDDATTAEGRHGLHLVSRADAPATVQAVPATLAPAERLDLPVLTAMVEGSTLAPRRQTSWHRERPLIALAIFAIALLTAAAGLRWFAPAPAAVASPPPEPAMPLADTRLERPFAPPAPAAATEGAGLSFPPVEVAPAVATVDRAARTVAKNRPAPPARVVSAPPRPAPKPRETRETISPPPAACTSNMAALGFCTLAPASAKE